MYQFLKLGLVLSGMIPLLGWAQTSPSVECISAQEIAVLAKDFTQFAPLAKAQLCDDQSKDFVILSTLKQLRNIKFESAMPIGKDDLYQNRFNFVNGWYAYFTGRIKILKPGHPVTCQDGVVAYVKMSVLGNDKTMYVCPAFFEKNQLTLARVSIMLHEARHKDGFPHITCTKGPRKDVPGACDQRISDKGSYAVSVDSLSQISKYAKGLNPALKLFTASEAIAYTGAFQETPNVNANDFLLLRTTDNRLLKIDSSLTSVQVVNIQLDEGKLVDKNNFTVVLPTDKNIKASILSNIRLEKIDTISKTVDIYNQASAADRSNWVDINYGNALSIIKKNEVEFICDTSKLDNRTKVALPAGHTAFAMLYPFAKTDVTRTQDYLRTDSGDILELSCDQNKVPRIKVSNLKLDRLYARIYNIKDIVLGLGADNKLYKIQGSSSVLVPATSQLSLNDIAPRHSYMFF